MHLKTLTVKGFKSFAEPTTLQFEPGVTCVVGPNGSGKSNVVDALAWVMGEQGAKSLRGGSMEDVIFAGTQSRGPLGRAEVSLTIDNSDGLLPIDYTEVTISRTLFRNGASEYAINREPCRLLDVQELLSDTGLGREMHVVVGQGQLDRVLYASSDDRRKFIEEAAGIMKHRRRKDKTVRKLEAMEGNLTRLQDLVNEIRRQLKPLGRQAEVAREAQSIQAAVRDAKARLLADDVATLQRELADYQANEGQTASERALVQSELDRVIAEGQALEAQLAANPVTQARALDASLRQVAERIDSLHALAAERVSLLAESDDQIDFGPAVSSEDIQAAEAQVTEAREALAQAEVDLGDLAATTASARAALEAFDSEADAARLARDAWLREHRERQEALAVAGSKLDSRVADVEAARQGVEAADSRIAQLETQWHESQAGLDGEGDDDLAAAETALQDAWRVESEATQRVDELRTELHRVEREKDALAATLHTLRLAIEAETAATENPAGASGRVAELISITPGYETAIARGLGALADALVVASRQSALSLSESVSGQDDKRLSLVVDEDQPGDEVLELEGLTAATSVVTGPTGVVRLLRRVFIAPSLDEVKRHWVGHPELPRDVVIVTTAGDVFSGSVVQAGSGSGRSTVELIAERDQAEANLQRVSTEVERAAGALEKAQADAQAASTSAKEALAAVRESEASKAARSEALSGIAASLDAARAERDRAQARLDQAEAGRLELEAELTAMREAAEEVGEEPQVVVDDTQRAMLVEALEAARVAEVDARVAVEAARSEVGYRESQVSTLQQRQAAWHDAQAREVERQAQRRAMHQTAQAVAGLTPALVRVARASVEESAAEVARIEAARSQAEQLLLEARTKESELRERVSAITDTVHSMEMHIYERNLHLQQLTERALEELGLDVDVLIAEYGPDQMVPGQSDDAEPVEFDREDQQQRLAKAHKQLDALGRVNPLALEEFDALEKRHAYLVEQLEDVQASKRDLLAIVDGIDDTMRGVFMEAFEDTKAAFDEVFPVLFPGGQGALTLTDPDNPLTTGVDVAVRPRGKKIERLSLLSGGERSLAAVALLIAIFIARPSPFYILDEVEAALDDANLGRLLEVMEKLRRDSQLVIITHQKRTMEIADALYGVSMRDDGVSAVVGQRVRDEVLQAS